MAKRRKRIVKPKYITKEERRKLEKKPMSKEHKLGLALGAAVLVLAIILFSILYDDGSLPVEDGQAAITGDNWIVSNLSASNSKKYYKLGEVNAIEGFTADPEQSMKTDTNERDYWFVPDDESSQIMYYYVAGVSKRPGDMAADVQTSFLSMYGDGDVSDVMTATIGGYDAVYFTAVTVNTTDAEEEKTTQMLCVYLPAERNTSILISVSASVTEDEPALSNDALLEFADRAASQITVGRK